MLARLANELTGVDAQATHGPGRAMHLLRGRPLSNSATDAPRTASAVARPYCSGAVVASSG